MKKFLLLFFILLTSMVCFAEDLHTLYSNENFQIDVVGGVLVNTPYNNFIYKLLIFDKNKSLNYIAVIKQNIKYDTFYIMDLKVYNSNTGAYFYNSSSFIDEVEKELNTYKPILELIKTQYTDCSEDNFGKMYCRYLKKNSYWSQFEVIKE